MGLTRQFLVVLFLGLALQAYGSSHSEAPGTAKKPSSDITDYYMFRSYEDPSKLILAMGILGLQHPFAGPNYYTLSDQHFFEFHLSCNDGDTDSDHLFQFYFGSTLGGVLNASQTYDSYDYDCVYTPTIPNEVYQGFAFDIGTPNPISVGIPLKVYGAITDRNSAINWYDYYYMNYVTGYTAGTGFTLAKTTQISPSSPPDANFRVPFAYVGTKTFGEATAYETYARSFIYTTGSIPWLNNKCSNTGIRTFVGPRQEPFSIDLGRTFDLVNYAPTPQGTANCYSNWDIRNLNTHYIVLEVPIQCIECANTDVISSWAAVRELMHTDAGDHQPGQQTNRFGNPLINELIIGIHEKSYWNYEHPEDDDNFAFYYRFPTFPKILEVLFQVPAPLVNSNVGGRHDIDEVLNGGIPGVNRPTPSDVFYCDMMRLNLTTPVSTGNKATDFNPYGVLAGDLAGYPNGRRLFDDVVDITLQVAMGALCRDAFASFNLCADPANDAPARDVEFRDGSPIAKTDFDDTFPFLRTPTPGSVTRPHPLHCSPASVMQVSSIVALLLLVGLFF